MKRIDQLSEQLKRAKTLVKLCKDKLTKTDEEIKKHVSVKSRIIQQGDQREKWDDNPTICEYWVGLWECAARNNP